MTLSPPVEEKMTIRNGLVFDGDAEAPRVADLSIANGRIHAIGNGIPAAGREIDATGHWVTPGFIDIHTHYDAELLLEPSLSESVRHGVTTVFVGSCSLSTVFADELDCADLFSRVEAVPREHVLAALDDAPEWNSPESYAQAIDGLELGPNVAAFAGHSDLRAAVMGLGRSVDSSVSPTKGELAEMKTLLTQALDAGFLGLSCSKSVFDKLDGDRYRSRQLPAVYARPRENRALYQIVRQRGRVVQALPDVTTATGLIGYLGASVGRWRQPLKVSILAAADPKINRATHHMFGMVDRLINRLGGGSLKFQHLPVPFEVYADGIDLVVFEELRAGSKAMHLADLDERDALLEDESFRVEFREEYDARFPVGAWHRSFEDAEIVACPDPTVVGRTFGEIARSTGNHPVDTFLDLVVEHGRTVRWRTTLANDRREPMDKLSSAPYSQIGFSDSGAHLRNMAFYDFALHLLRRAHDAEGSAAPFLTVNQAVRRVTSELADWYGIDAGRLRTGDRADLAIIDPKGLDASLDDYHEAEIPAFGGFARMVKRNNAVQATIVGGQVVWVDGHSTGAAGGRFLRACADDPTDRFDHSQPGGD